MIYATIEPFGEERADIRNAINTVAIVNHLRMVAKAYGGKPKGQDAKIEDFMPFREEPEPVDLRAKWLRAIGKTNEHDRPSGN